MNELKYVSLCCDFFAYSRTKMEVSDQTEMMETSEVTANQQVEEGGGGGANNFNDYMDVITTYKCRFCNFTCEQPQGIGFHVRECHFPKQDAEVQERPPVTNTGDPDPRGAILQHVEVEQDPAPPQHVEIATSTEETVEAYVPVSIESEVPSTAEHAVQAENASQMAPPVSRELFLCGQCNMGFGSIEECKKHMMRDHTFTGQTAESETSMPQFLPSRSSSEPDISPGPGPGKVSIGTQCVTMKKPGRKRKIKGLVPTPKPVVKEVR